MILTFNSEQYLKQCLDSIFSKTRDVKFEVIVVDNQSTDKSVEIVKSYGDKVKLIQASENGGYSKGNNIGINAGIGKYVLIVNPDTQLVENSIERLFLWMEAHRDCAAVAPQIVDNELQPSSISGAAYFPTLSRIFAWAFFIDDLPLLANVISSYHPHTSMDHWIFNRKKSTTKPVEESARETFPDWVNGSFWMISRQAISQVGLLDENIFMYGEEVEWCFRAHKAGWKIGCTPITKVIHLERKSSGEMGSRNSILGEFRGLKYIYGKHEAQWRQIVLGTILDVAAFLRVVFWLVRLKPQMVKIYLEALVL